MLALAGMPCSAQMRASEWDTLAPCEQVRVIRLPVQRVVYDGEQSTVSVTFHPAGIKTLADELEEAGK